MVKIEEHKQKMKEIKSRAEKTTGKTRLQLMKCYHRLQKQLQECDMHLKGSDKTWADQSSKLTMT